MLHELRLFHFRNHRSFYWRGGPQPVILTGANGVGKTSILEAISFLAPGRGLRGAKLAEIDAWGQEEPWAVYAEAETPLGRVHIGTGRGENSQTDKRIIKVDGEKLKTAGRLKEHIAILSLTPLQDRVFVDGAGARREFLDHLTTGFDAEHARRLSRFDDARAERLKLLLKIGGYDAVWVAGIEARMAEEAVAIAAARLEAVERIRARLEQVAPGPFPVPALAVDGSVESDLRAGPALQAEEAYRARLVQARDTDREAGRTLEGPHRSDFLVMHQEKRMPAEFCSTGEQKALLLSLVLATAEARKHWQGFCPILLLDEVVAHLDATRRKALAERIHALGAQVWMTGTEIENFSDFLAFSQHVEVAPPPTPLEIKEEEDEEESQL